MTNAEAWFSVALRPRKPLGSLGRKAQDGHLDFHTAELCAGNNVVSIFKEKKKTQSRNPPVSDAGPRLDQTANMRTLRPC